MIRTDVAQELRTNRSSFFFLAIFPDININAWIGKIERLNTTVIMYKTPTP